MHDGNVPVKSIALTWYPIPNYQSIDQGARYRMVLLQDLIRVARDERKNRDIPEKESVPMVVLASSIKDFGTDRTRSLRRMPKPSRNSRKSRRLRSKNAEAKNVTT